MSLIILLQRFKNNIGTLLGRPRGLIQRRLIIKLMMSLFDIESLKYYQLKSRIGIHLLFIFLLYFIYKEDFEEDLP